MSRKGNDAPAAVRIRENQRRSRARRKELIDELQAKVKSYEERGVTATQEVQVAARKVALENVRLRGLLAELGVSEQRITAHLQSFGHDGNTSFAPDLRSIHSGSTHCTSQISYAKSPGSELPHLRESLNNLESTALKSSQDPVPPSPRRSGAMMTQKAPNGTTQDLSRSYRPIPNSDQSEQHFWEDEQEVPDHDPGPAECPNTSTCFCGPTAAIESPSSESGLDISCNTAAAIIAGMRADADRDTIRKSLGCVDDQDCRVKNFTVLQLLDDS